MTTEENKQMKKLITLGIVVLVIVVLVLMSIFTIPAGRVGVVTRFGAVNRVAYPGINIKVPFAEGVYKTDIRIQKDQVPATAASFDMQDVNSVIAVNYHVDGKNATKLYQEIGRNYKELVVAPAIQEAYKAVTVRYTAEQLLQRRAEVSSATVEELQLRLQDSYIIVDAVSIIDSQFGDEYSNAIEAKQVAQQNVQTAKLELEKSKVEAEKRVVEARAQADAQKALKDTGALSPEYLKYLFLTKWNGVLPQVTGGANPVFDISGYIGEE